MPGTAFPSLLFEPGASGDLGIQISGGVMNSPLLNAFSNSFTSSSFVLFDIVGRSWVSDVDFHT